MTPVDPDRMALLERLNRFADELRARGIPVSMVERIDAMRAVEGTALDNAHGLRSALGATLVKSADHLAVFDEVFQLFFRAGRGSRDPGSPADPDVTDPVSFDLDHALRAVLQDGSESLARIVAEQAVQQFSGFEAGRPVAGIRYESRAVAGLRLDQVSAELSRDAAATSATGGGSSGARGALSSQLDQQQIADRAEALRQRIREVIRDLLVADRGIEAVAKTLRTPLPSDVAISMANPAQLAEIERVMQPLQRKLATTMMRKRRRRAGPLDVRATLRSSMATGGVPVRLVHRHPTPTKPKLYVLADVSGSVATFAAFTISLVSAMTEQFSRLRTFAFVENAVEVTDLFAEVDNALDAVTAINRLGGLNFYSASTDYGRALRQFWHEVGPQLGRRSTVLVFGDARGNYRPAEVETLAHIARRAGALYWLNPESESQWGSGDSVMDVYAGYCTAAVTCRTLNDLRHFVEGLD